MYQQLFTETTLTAMLPLFMHRMGKSESYDLRVGTSIFGYQSMRIGRPELSSSTIKAHPVP